VVGGFALKADRWCSGAMASAPQRTAADDVESLISGPDAMPPATRITVEAVRDAAAAPGGSPETATRALPPPLNAGAGGGADGIGKGRFAGATITRMVVTFYPHPHLWTVRPVSFEMRISMAYPANPPTVRCTDEAFVLEHGARANLDSSGKPALHVLSTESLGWNRTYTLADAVHCVRRCLFRTGAPLVTIVPASPLVVTTSGNAATLGTSGGGTFSFSSTGAQVPLSTRTGSFMGFTDPALAADIAALGSSARSRRGSVSSTVEGMAPLRSPSSAALHQQSLPTSSGATSSPKASGHSGAGILAGQSLAGTFGSMSSMSAQLSVGRSGTVKATSPARLSGVFAAAGSGGSPESTGKPDDVPAVTAATHTYRRRRSGDATAAGAAADGGGSGENADVVGLNSDPSTHDLLAAAAPKTPTSAAASAAAGKAGAETGGPESSAPAPAVAPASAAAGRRRGSSGLVTALPVSSGLPSAGGRPASGGSLRSASSAANLNVLHAQASHRTPRGSALPPGPLVKLLSAHSGLQVRDMRGAGGGGGLITRGSS